jgi:hypothetical protein
MAQMGFFDLSDSYASLDAKRDPLVEIDAVVPWEEFRPALESEPPRLYQRVICSTTRCPIPDVCIDERRLPLFIARATLRELIAGLQARATGETAR